MAKRIITISREFGSGGRFIGEEVAQQLGIAYYSENIIDQIAQQSGLSPDISKKMQNYPQRKDFLPMHFRVVILQGNPWTICCMRHRER